MPLSTLSLRRPLTSYAKVQTWIGSSLRPAMGAREQLAARVLGWKLARRLQRLLS